MSSNPQTDTGRTNVNAVSTSESEAAKVDRQLGRHLTFIDFFFMAMGAIIGSGWLLAAISGAATAGPSVVFSWLIGGVFVMFIAYAYAELGGMIPRTGGIVRYPHYTHGGFTGYILGWLYLLSAVSVPAIEAEAVVTYAAIYIPTLTYSATVLGHSVTVLTAEGTGLAALLLILFFFLNFFGIKVLGKTNTYVTIWKFVIPTLTFIFLFTLFKGSNFTAYGGLFPSNVSAPKAGFNAMLYAIPSTGIIFSYLGFRQAVEYAGEGKNPARDVPRATILAVVSAIVIYTLLQVAFIGGIDWSKISIASTVGSCTAGAITPGNWGCLTASNWASGPFYSILTASGIALFGAFGTILLADAWISPTGTGWVYSGTSTRTFYGLATDGYLHRSFLKLSRYKIPIVSLVASLVVGALFLLPFPSWYLLVGFISSATAMTYIAGGISLQVLRKTAPELKRVVRVKAAMVIAPIASIAAILIGYWSGFTILWYIMGGLFVGLPLFTALYGPAKMGLNKGVAYILAAAEFVGVIGLGYYSYYQILAPSSTTTATAALLSSWSNNFLIYWVAFAVLIFGMSAVTHKLANEYGKKIMIGGYWVLGLFFAIYLLSFYGSFGVDTLSFLSFPTDTIIAAVIVLVFHYFAVYTGFRTDSIEEVSREQGSDPTPV